MPDLPPAQIHPTAFVDETSTIGPGVVVGPRAHVGPHCVIGAGTRLGIGAIVQSHTTLGRNNTLHAYAVLGQDPQDRAYNPATPGRLIVGDDNIFFEHVTISRSTGEDRPTRIGNRCMFMAGSHAGHNAIVHDNVILVNCAALAGWAEVGAGTVLSAYSGVHQFTRVGAMSMLQVGSTATQHIPPYCILTGINTVAGLNTVGLRRNPAITDQDRREIKRVYQIIYRERQGSPLEERLRRAEAPGVGPAAQVFIDFVRGTLADEGRFRRGLAGARVKRERLPYSEV